jgi:hypothetical protein
MEFQRAKLLQCNLLVNNSFVVAVWRSFTAGLLINRLPTWFEEDPIMIF